MFTETSQMPVCVRPPGTHRCCLRIGEVSIGLSSSSADDIRIAEELNVFRRDSPYCDIEIRIGWTQQLQRLSHKRIFDSGSLWTLYENRSSYIFDFATSLLGSQPYKRLYVDRDFSQAQLFLNRQCLTNVEQVYPLEYPLDELMITNWLACGRGVEVHGCGLVDFETGGHLFLGHSGSGKSTTTLLWKSMRNVRILSDDRIILRNSGNDIWMHGTPWHGEAGFATNQKKKISRIFILEHGGRSEILPLDQSRAVGELFARCFPPFYSRESLDFIISCLLHITNSIPCYIYRFVPEPSAVEQILTFHD